MRIGIHETKGVLSHRYNVSISVLGAFFIILIIGFGWLNTKAEKISVYKSIKLESNDLRQFLENKMIFANYHVFIMQYAVQSKLKHPELGNPSHIEKLITEAKDKEMPFNDYPEIHKELGDLQIDTSKPIYPEIYRDISAAISMMPEVIAVKTKGVNFVWSYYYDAKKRWEVSYPFQTKEELFKTTKTKTMTDAMEAIFIADDTYPVEAVSPERNPSRQNVWTQPYMDVTGGGLMVTLLAPVYLDNDYIGVVGTDITLKFLDKTLLDHPLSIGRSFILDMNNNVIADSAGSLREATKVVKLPDLISEPFNNDNLHWIIESFNNSPFKLVVYIDPKEIPNKSLFGN